MHAIDKEEANRHRGTGSTLNSVILLSLVVGLAAIGAQAPDGQYAALNCAHGAAEVGATGDAAPGIAEICGTGTSRAPARAATVAAYGVPEASSALDPDAVAEPLPPTF